MKTVGSLARGRDEGSVALYAFFVACLILLLCIAIYFYPPITRLFQHQSENYNEGWNAFHAARLFSDKLLYPPIEEFVVNNYPPVSFLIVGAAGALLGDTLVAGRLVALISLFVVAAAVAVIVKRLTGSSRSSALGALILLGVLGGQYQYYIALDDPQMLAHVFMVLGALALLVRPLRVRYVIIASALMLLGGFTKHMLLPFPLAATGWLFFYDRRLFRLWVMFGGAGALAAFAVCSLFFGDSFFASVFAHKREISAGLFLVGISALTPLLTFVVIGVAPLALARGVKSDEGLFALATVAAVIVGLLARSGRGVDSNSFFDIAIHGIPACIAAVHAIAGSINEQKTARTVSAVLWLLILAPALAPAPMRLPYMLKWHAEQDGRREAAAELIAVLRSMDGDIACQRVAYCYWAGKPFAFDFFNVSQAAHNDPKIRAAAEEIFSSGKFSALQINVEGAEKDWPFNSALQDNYAEKYKFPFYGSVLTPP